MLTSSARSASGTKVEMRATTTSGRERCPHRGPEALADLGERGRKQSVAAHREEDPALPEEQDHHHRRQTDERPDRDRGREARVSYRAERRSEWCGDMDLVVLHHSGDHEGHGHVQGRADAQGREDADRHVALGVLGLLGRRGHDVEADVGEEHQRRAGEDAADPEGTGRDADVLQQRGRRRRAGRRVGTGGRDERRVVAPLDEEQSRHDDEQDDAHLDDDEDEVDL